MKSLVRKIGVYVWHAVVCASIAALLITAIAGSFYLYSVRQRQQTERLLRRLEALQPGANIEKAQAIAHEFGGTEHCAGDGCTYDFEKGFVSMKSGVFFPLRRTEWDYVGLRPWRVDAQIQTRNGTVSSIEFNALVGRGRGWLYNEGPLLGNDWAWWGVTLSVNANRFGQVDALQAEYAREYSADSSHVVQPWSGGIVVRKPAFNIGGGGEALLVDLSPTATLASRKAAYDINLRCATSAVGCTELCQVAPSAWQVYARYQHSNGWAVTPSVNCTAP